MLNFLFALAIFLAPSVLLVVIMLLYFRFTEGNPDALRRACRWGLHEPKDNDAGPCVCAYCGHEIKTVVCFDDEDEFAD